MTVQEQAPAEVVDAGLVRAVHAEHSSRPGQPYCGDTSRGVTVHECAMPPVQPLFFWLNYTRCPGCGIPLCGYCRLMISNLTRELGW